MIDYEEMARRLILNGAEGKIFKCSEIVLGNIPKDENKTMIVQYIVKHSPELLDLIKAEDVIKIKTGLYSSFMHFVVDEDDLIYIKAQMEAGFWIIDKIYTKEMMEAISYKVKE